ncbi:MAG: SAM-dependent chlorinase/fluorinase [Candidatus Moraniibacteriota bacterium]|nr:MAG: SAM-dependent chlorinase/fluorinase [Candidatus Moranbacteria bacterium]
MNKKKPVKHVVVITDCKDVAFCEIRRQILSECEKLGNSYTEIEPLIPAEEFSITNGAFLTRLMAEHYKEDVIFMLILNPSQQRPKRIFGELANGIYFEGADTGTLNWLFDDFGIKSLYEIKESKFYPFGGKYVHSPMVAKIASRISFEEYGKELSKDELCDFSVKKGVVVHIDNFGLMKIKDQFPDYPEGTKVRIFVNGNESIEVITSARMMDHDTGTWVLYPGSSMGLPELGKVRCTDSARELNIRVGDVITWEKI